MPDLSFEVTHARPVPHAATPTVGLTLRVANRPADQAIQNVQLRCQIRIETTRRHYSDAEKARLVDLFGEPSRWDQTLRSMLWTHVNVIVPPFRGQTEIELPVGCTYDFNVATTKYFDALENGSGSDGEGDGGRNGEEGGEGEIPLCLLFSGTVFYQTENGAMQIAQVSWEKEADFCLPVRVWREMMDLYYPNTAWLNLRKDVFDRLQRYKSRCGQPTWEQALENLLDAAETETEAEAAEPAEAKAEPGGPTDIQQEMRTTGGFPPSLRLSHKGTGATAQDGDHEPRRNADKRG